MRQLLRWTFIGPLIGVIAVSPLTLSISGLFGKPWLPDLAVYSAFVYLLGIPAALATGFACRRLTKRIHSIALRNILITLIGALASAYPLWLSLPEILITGRFRLETMPALVIPMAIGLVSTIGMLSLEVWLSNMRIGRWSRIGVVLSILYGAVVALFAYHSRPQTINVEFAWIREAETVIAQRLSESERRTVDAVDVAFDLMPAHADEDILWLERAAATPSEKQLVYSTQIADLNKKYRDRIQKIPQEQRKHSLLAVVWWMGGTAIMFAFGWTVRWIYRGFRPVASQ